MTRIIRLALTSLSVLSLFTLAATATEKTKDADNTAQNERDRKHEEVVPLDQSNRSDDLDTTKRIRQAIMADKSLSLDAHNVKVITANGHVTLRGPVKTEDEKRIVCALAVEVATAENVENKLEVKINN
jgi:hyperosmotically inducible periplasmic protein